MSITAYYGKNGYYLEDHKNYLTDAVLHRDVDCIVKSLQLTKKDTCLDLQCAQGRITIELAKMGHLVDGVDNSEHMLSLAKAAAKKEHLDITFIKEDVHRLKLSKQYSKVFIFFPEWTEVDLQKVVMNVSRVMKRGGLFLCDQDTLFRVWDYLKKHPKAPFSFDPVTMELREEGEKVGNRYYTFPELQAIFQDAGLKIIKTYGGWSLSDGPYRFDSKRLRVIAKKM